MLKKHTKSGRHTRPVFNMSALEEKYLNMFKELYQKKEGKNLSNVDVVKKFNNLIVLVKSVYRPIPKSKKNEFEALSDQIKNQ